MSLEQKAKEIILDILEKHRGPNVRISRVELLRRINHDFVGPEAVYISDRKMRNLIEELRTETTQGAWICSSLDGGYYLAADLKELEDYLEIDQGRAKRILQRVNNQRKHARERQPGIQERML